MASPDIDDLLREATDPTTRPERLEEISEVAWRPSRSDETYPYAPIRRAVAAHPNASPQLLAVLLEYEPAGFAANPMLPLLLLEQPDFFAQRRHFMLMRLLREEQLPLPCVKVLTAHPKDTIAESARLHIALAGEASREEWQEEVRSSFKMPQGNDLLLLLELWELGAAPSWVRNWLAGSNQAFLRRACLLSPLAPDSTGMRGLRNAAHRATGSKDFARLEPDYDPTLSAQTLSHLAGCGPWLRRAAARHPNTPQETLRQLVHSEQDRIVRDYVARNPAAPLDVLQALACATDPTTRLAVAHNPSLPEELRAVLSRDADPRVRDRITRQQHSSPQSPRIPPRNTHTGTPSSRPPFTQMPRERRQQIAAARDRRTNASLLEQLALSGDLRISLAALANPATPLTVLKQIGQACGPELMSDAYDILLLDYPLADLFEEGPEEGPDGEPPGAREVQRRLAAHPSVPKRTARNLLWKLITDDAPAVRRTARIIARTRFPEDIELERQLVSLARSRALEQAVWYSGHPLFRFLALMQPDTPGLVLESTAVSDIWRDRLAIVLNPDTPEHILADLAADGNRLVRAAAQDRQRQLPGS